MGELNVRALRERYWGIKMKCDTTDYVGGGTPHAKVDSSQITGASPHMGYMYQFGVIPITFYVTLLFRQAYRRNR